MNTTAGKTVFIEYSSANKGQHFMTVVQTMDHKRQIIGRIYREYDENKKVVYRAEDWGGNAIFVDFKDLPTLKKKFIEHGKSLAQFIPKVPGKERDQQHYIGRSSRQQEIQKTRERKPLRPSLEKKQEAEKKVSSEKKEVSSEKQYHSADLPDRDQQLRSIRSGESHDRSYLEQEGKAPVVYKDLAHLMENEKEHDKSEDRTEPQQDTFNPENGEQSLEVDNETSEREMELEDIRSDDDGRDQDMDIDF